MGVLMRAGQLLLLAGFGVLLLPASTALAGKTITIAEAIRDRVKLDGKTITVRGIYRRDIHGDFLDIDLDTRPVDEKKHWIDIGTLSIPIHEFYGRLERSVVRVTGVAEYRRHCDRRLPLEVITLGCRGLRLNEISALEILDTYAADDPRLPKMLYADITALPESDPEYPRLKSLARRWRKAILRKDFDALARLSGNPLTARSESAKRQMKEAMLDKRRFFWNVAFRGTDSLQNQFRRNKTNPVFIGVSGTVEHIEGHVEGPRGYPHVDICYCLRETCTARHAESLNRVYAHNLKDPYWCFSTYWYRNRRWVIWN